MHGQSSYFVWLNRGKESIELDVKAAAYDLLVQCEAGLLSVTGTQEEPAKAGISVADIAAGMYAYSGVLTALYERERTGLPTSFDVAMLDALGEWMSQPYYYTVYGARPPQRTGARHASISPYGPYAAPGGGRIFIGLQNDREWAVLCERILHRPGLIADPVAATAVLTQVSVPQLRWPPSLCI